MAKTKLVVLIGAIILVAFVTAFGGCGGGGGGSSGSSAPAIAAPSNLQVTKSYTYGMVRASLTWTDNSNNEIYFFIYGKPEGGGWLQLEIAMGGETSINIDGIDLQYPTATKVYFRVAAMDESGMESNPSNEVFITLP